MMIQIWKKIWKEVGMTWLHYCPGISMYRIREARKISVMKAKVLTENWNGHILKPDLECYINDVLGTVQG